MATHYDLIVIGSGPGGYVAAIRAAQLGMHVAVVEKESVGGICLNWGCIPTKALLKSAQCIASFRQAATYGIHVRDIEPDWTAIIERSRAVATEMNQGIHYLFKKNTITLLPGVATLRSANTVAVQDPQGHTVCYQAPHILVATGGRSRTLPQLPIDGQQVLGYRDALVLKNQPKSVVIVGAGAIGVEFAYFYHTLGTQVTLVEYQPRIVPLEDEAIAHQLATSFTKAGIQIYTSTEVKQVTTGPLCTVQLQSPTGTHALHGDVVLSAVGIVANVTGLGLEQLGVTLDQGKIVVDDYYRTQVPGVYAVGDVVKGPALAHVASTEGIICVEKIAGLHPEPLDYTNIPSCTYCQPEIASVGYTEQAARAAGYTIKVGTFPFKASGKARAAGATEGFVKVIFDAQYGEWLGAHCIGAQVTELIAEVVVARKLETTAQEIITAVHPHPTLSEAVMEAVAVAYGEGIHL